MDYIDGHEATKESIEAALDAAFLKVFKHDVDVHSIIVSPCVRDSKMRISERVQEILDAMIPGIWMSSEEISKASGVPRATIANAIQWQKHKLMLHGMILEGRRGLGYRLTKIDNPAQ